MKSFFKELFRLLNNDLWYLLLPRIVFLLFFGWLVLLRPALSLRLCSWLLLFLAGAGVLFVYEKISSPARHITCLLPAAAAGALIFPAAPDTAGIWFAAGICLITALRAGVQNTFSSRAVSGMAAFAFLVLLVKGVTSVWFDMYPAVSLAFFASAVWESGNLKFINNTTTGAILR